MIKTLKRNNKFWKGFRDVYLNIWQSICHFDLISFISQKKDKKIEINNDNLIEKQEIDFNKILQDFESQFINGSSEKFYSGLLEILRDILEDLWNKNISKMTFDEIQKLELDNSLKNVIKSIYYKEYVKKIEDSREIRMSFINKIKELIK